MSEESGDFGINVAGENPPFHPHITAPYLMKVMQERGLLDQSLKYFIVIRNPINMLASYYKFFQPDENFRYNYDPDWGGRIGIGFDEWVANGRVGMNEKWKELAPNFISTENLSTLSLEAHAMSSDSRTVVDNIFLIEESESIVNWVGEKTGESVVMPQVNKSEEMEVPKIGNEALDCVRKMMPLESALYNL
ncbi:hypothetical protein [Nioella nitratireducens]|uniref:hypothetical protein n=1 Tax=Nioella nitratireducens TaxID=1287720 RepID=UPI0011BA6F54|nr:hypothetical protein [Nioella nitratireducens]